MNTKVLAVLTAFVLFASMSLAEPPDVAVIVNPPQEVTMNGGDMVYVNYLGTMYTVTYTASSDSITGVVRVGVDQNAVPEDGLRRIGGLDVFAKDVTDVSSTDPKLDYAVLQFGSIKLHGGDSMEATYGVDRYTVTFIASSDSNTAIVKVGECQDTIEKGGEKELCNLFVYVEDVGDVSSTDPTLDYAVLRISDSSFNIVDCGINVDCPSYESKFCTAQGEFCQQVTSRECVNNTCVSASYDVTCEQCDFGCTADGCKTTECTDTDVTDQYPDGKNHFLKGTVKYLQFGDVKQDTDSCENNKLRELYCQGGSVDGYHIDCPNGYSCSDGKCIVTTNTCDNMDCPSTIEHFCDGNNACTREVGYYCENGECVEKPSVDACRICPNGCAGGICKNTGCYDSDGGRNIFKKGYAKSAGKLVDDVCAVSKCLNCEHDEAIGCKGDHCWIFEAECKDNQATFAKLKCPGMCDVGKCVGREKPKLMVINPNGGQVWERGTSQQIKWNTGTVTEVEATETVGYTVTGAVVSKITGKPVAATDLKPTGAIKDNTKTERICPTVCVGMWELKSRFSTSARGGGMECVYNECGSGCGANGKTTFDTKEECQEMLPTTRGFVRIELVRSGAYDKELAITGKPVAKAVEISDVAHVEAITKPPEYFSLVIAAKTENDGHFSWRIPENLPVGRYKVKITELSTGKSDQSDRPFTIIGEDIPGTGFILEFSEGWNMFSVPMSTVKVTLDETDCKPTSSVWYLSENGYRRMTNIRDLHYGFWIRMDEDCKVTLQVHDDYSIHKYYERAKLHKGWNIIGGMPETLEVENVKGDCEFERGPYWYNPESGEYEESTIFEPGKGYAIKTTNACQLSSNDMPPPLPV